MRYQWKNQGLKKKASNYNWLMISSMILVLALLYLLPENLKFVNIFIILLAALFWYLGYRTQSQDKKLRGR